MDLDPVHPDLCAFRGAAFGDVLAHTQRENVICFASDVSTLSVRLVTMAFSSSTVNVGMSSRTPSGRTKLAGVGVDLDPIDAVWDMFAHRLASLAGTSTSCTPLGIFSSREYPSRG